MLLIFDYSTNNLNPINYIDLFLYQMKKLLVAV